MRGALARIALAVLVATSIGACAERQPAGPLLPDTPLETESPPD